MHGNKPCVAACIGHVLLTDYTSTDLVMKLIFVLSLDCTLKEIHTGMLTSWHFRLTACQAAVDNRPIKCHNYNATNKCWLVGGLSLAIILGLCDQFWGTISEMIARAHTHRHTRTTHTDTPFIYWNIYSNFHPVSLCFVVSVHWWFASSCKPRHVH